MSPNRLSNSGGDSTTTAAATAASRDLLANRMRDQYGQLSPTNMSAHDEWVEIIEPKSKTKIYANLESGICAKNPPEGAKVSRSKDFSDHWWELYDQKTSKFYYYNPEKQKTSWTRPVQSDGSISNGSNGSSDTGGEKNGKQCGKRLLIIPVSRLQTHRQTHSPRSIDGKNNVNTNIDINTGGQSNYFDQHDDMLNLNSRAVKCDASTQTASTSSDLVSVGTQTIHDDCDNNIGQQGAPGSSNDDESYADDETDRVRQDNIDRNLRQVEQKFSSLLYNHNSKCRDTRASNNHRPLEMGDDDGEDFDDDHDDVGDDDNDDDDEDDRSNNLHDDSISISNASRECDSSEGWKSPNGHSPVSFNSIDIKSYNATHQNSHPYQQQRQAPPPTPPPPPPVSRPPPPTRNIQQNHVPQHDPAQHNNHQKHSPKQLVSLLNLSKEENNPSSRNQELDNKKLIENFRKSRQTSSFGTTGHEGSLGRSRFKMVEGTTPDTTASIGSTSTNNPSTVGQRIRNVADSYLHAISDKRNKPPSDIDNKLPQPSVKSSQYRRDLYKAAAASTERHLRQLSALSTLPRPRKETKDKIALSKQHDSPNFMVAGPLAPNNGYNSPQLDSDYDVVEENCSNITYRSDPEQQTKLAPSRPLSSMATSNILTNSFTPVSNSMTKNPSISSTTEKHTSNDDAKSKQSQFDRNTSTRGSTFSVEMFARENLARHPKKGGLLFNRKIKWSRMISWTKSSIKHPMMSSVSSDLTQDSINSFKLIQQYMGDREVTMNKKYRQLLTTSQVESSASTDSNPSGFSNIIRNPSSDEIDKLDSSSSSRSILNTSNNSGGSGNKNSTTSNNNNNNNNNGSTSHHHYHVPDRIRDELAYELVVKSCAISALRDEVYIQMARQLTENPNPDSTRLGFVLLAILFNYFSPSSKFAPFLRAFLESHQHQMAKDVCLPRLERRLRQNWLTYCRKPIDGLEVSMVRLSITKWPQTCGVFGESLEKIMTMQTCSPYLRAMRLPWILTTLGDKLLETGGDETEGVFRCAADHDLLAQLRLKIDCVDFRKITDAKQPEPLLSSVQDPHVIAGLLKLFFRQLPEPIFPSHLYDVCLSSSQDIVAACRVFEDLPNLNKDIVAYLTRLLQKLSRPEKVINTKMDDSNLAMIWAPNLLRAPPAAPPPTQSLDDQSSMSGSKWSISNWGVDEQHQQQSATSVGANQGSSASSTLPPSQTMIFEQTRQEMHFIRSLIANLETSFIENVV